MKQKLVGSWLIMLAAFILAIIALGGYTRLSGSGLSIVEWRPITGVFPPLNEESWEIEFSKYQQSPEYIDINYEISLEQFKRLFLIEYAHRLLGRFIGLLFFFPWLYFLYKKIIPCMRYFTIFLLLVLQGFIGWFMVKSGLINVPHVNHYMLLMHLGIAIAIYSIILWNIHKIYYPGSPFKDNKNPASISILSISLFVLVAAQILLGALVAGLKGGMVYNSFPLMGDTFVPREFFQHSFTQMFDDPACTQFFHRILAYTIFLLSINFALKIKNLYPKMAFTISWTVFAQVILGIWILINGIPIVSALLHQFVGIILLSCMLSTVYHTRNYDRS